MSDRLVIVPYDPAWPGRFAREEASIFAALGNLAFAVRHIGSTAVPGLAAKPIVDIMAGLPSLKNVPASRPRLEALGYEYLGEYGIPGRHYFRRPGGPAPARLFHVHMVVVGSSFWADHLLFRDYLRRHPDEAASYAALKQELAKRFSSDPPSYTDAKSTFIREALDRARGELLAGLGVEVHVADYDPSWPVVFAREREAVQAALGDLALSIEHVGSTAVPGLAAKPTVDLQVGLASLDDVNAVAALLEPLGYNHRGEQGVPGRHLFIKPADEAGPRRFNLHACALGSLAWQRTIAFRDHLRSHPAAASKYGDLKRELAARHAGDRDGYTFAKTGFVEDILSKALTPGV